MNDRALYMKQDREEIQQMISIIKGLLDRTGIEVNDKFGCGINGTMRRVIYTLTELFPIQPKPSLRTVEIGWSNDTEI